jgi:hypothetical protein
VQPCLSQVPAFVLERNRRVAGQKLHYDGESVFQQSACLALLNSDHDAVGRKGTGPKSKHGAPARQMIQQHQPFGYPEGIVVGDADDSGAKPDVPGPLGRRRDHQFRRGRDLGAGRVMFAKPGFVIAAAIEPLDQFQVALQGKRGVDPRLMERGEKDSEAQPRIHGHSSRYLRRLGRNFSFVSALFWEHRLPRDRCQRNCQFCARVGTSHRNLVGSHGRRNMFACSRPCPPFSQCRSAVAALFSGGFSVNSKEDEIEKITSDS